MYGKSKQDIGFDPSKTISKGKNAHDTYVSVENNTFWSLRSLCSSRVKYHRRPNFMEHFRLLLQRPHFQALECRRENSPCDKLLASCSSVKMHFPVSDKNIENSRSSTNAARVCRIKIFFTASLSANKSHAGETHPES